MNADSKQYDLILRQFVGDQLVSVYHLHTAGSLESFVEAGDQMAIALCMKDGRKVDDLPTWIDYHPDDAYRQLAVVEHGVTNYFFPAPITDREWSVAERGLINGAFKYELFFADVLNRFVGGMVVAGKSNGFDYRALPEYKAASEALVEYKRDRQRSIKPTRWNVPGRPGRETWEYMMVHNRAELQRSVATDVPVLASECQDHHAVKPATYELVHSLLGTSGCSSEEPFWTWAVIGVIESYRGKQLVYPGDWIVEYLNGRYLVMNDEEFQTRYGSVAYS